METLPEYSFNTFRGLLTLTCLGIVEPNNTRMLYKVKLTLNRVDVTNQYFDTWNFVNYDLNEYIPMSMDKKWIYIPKEGDHFLVSSETLEKVDLPYLSFSAISFRSNHFTEDCLVVISLEEIVLKNLRTGKAQSIKQPRKELYFRNANVLDSAKICIYYNDNSQEILPLNL